MVQLQKAPDAA